MIKYFLIGVLFLCVNFVFAQKQIIDSTAYKQWPSLEAPTISDDGKYVMYNIKNIPIGSKTLIVQSTDGKWKKEFEGRLVDGYTVLKVKCLWFLKNDSLGMLSLGTDKIKYIAGVSAFWFQKAGDDDYLIYRLENKEKTLIITNLKTHNKRYFSNIDDWDFKGNLLVLYRSIAGIEQQQSMNLLDLNTGKVSEIWQGNKPENLVLDLKHHQLAFKAGDSVWYYQLNKGKPVCILHNTSDGVKKGFALGYLDAFSKDGKFLFTSLIEKKDIKPKKGIVEVWSYTDIKLQSEQQREGYDERYFAVLNISTKKVIQLQELANEQFQFPSSNNSDSIALVTNGEIAEPWSIRYKLTTSLISIKDGSRKILKFLDNIDGVQFSPSGKYLIYFDKIQQNYFSYEISTQTSRNLTRDLNVPWIDIIYDDLNGGGPRGLNSLVWLNNDESVFIYDRYDVWKLDPKNIAKPINITNGYGKRHEIVFNYVRDLRANNIVKKDEILYLNAFSEQNKNNGFFLKELDKFGDPILLNMESYLYCTNSGYSFPGADFSPIKAKKTENYIVRRMSSVDAPNYFSTKDFKTFTRLSNLQPQKKYNWFTTELHTWKSLDGRKLHGILYKPENFDPNKKYPVIFHYYERKSDRLNSFIKPEYISQGMNIDIPTYVSNGYLIFTIDTYFNIGNPMESVYSGVVSAANYVSNLPFVNIKRMGIQGGSFGGLQTNYLVTHTGLFAAAVSSSGVADLVSGYGGLIYGKTSTQDYYETGQGRIGGSLWEKRESFIENSPLFQVDKVTTPLLIMHTKNDGICLFPNIIEFFTGLRRMGKMAWMLVYEGNHGIGGKAAEDFSLRMMQFFNHYLKDKPVPIWMLDKAINDRNGKDGLELDVKGRTPGPGLLTPQEKMKLDSIMKRKPIIMTLK